MISVVFLGVSDGDFDAFESTKWALKRVFTKVVFPKPVCPKKLQKLHQKKKKKKNVLGFLDLLISLSYKKLEANLSPEC